MSVIKKTLLFFKQNQIYWLDLCYIIHNRNCPLMYMKIKVRSDLFSLITLLIILYKKNFGVTFMGFRYKIVSIFL